MVKSPVLLRSLLHLMMDVQEEAIVVPRDQNYKSRSTVEIPSQVITEPYVLAGILTSLVGGLSDKKEGGLPKAATTVCQIANRGYRDSERVKKALSKRQATLNFTGSSLEGGT